MDTDIYVATETGDRLDTLAHQFYGDSSLGWLIASANNIHNASFGLEDGTVLRIPKDISQILTQL
jgi:phage tail protein X